MNYRVWKLRTGRRALLSHPIETSIILLSGAAGSFLVLFILLTYYWFSLAIPFYLDSPNPIKFTEVENLAEITSGSDQVWGQETADSKDAFADPHWILSWNEGIATGKRSGKPVVVDFRRDYCNWSIKMDKETLSSPEIRKRLENGWVCIRIDTNRSDKTGVFEGRTMSYRGMVMAFQAYGVPAFLFIDSSGKPVQRVIGYIPKEIFGALLDFMRERVYERNIPFEKYRADIASGRR
jgi:thioredoxin-related protein